MPRRAYSALPASPRRDHIADRATKEMESAFESDDESGQQESTPLTQNHHETSSLDSNSDDPLNSQASAAGGYDFEREYDHPPPGSPPSPSVSAQPNSYGNTNGLVPSPSSVPSHSSENRPRSERPSFFRRAVGVLLPTHYARVPTSDTEVPSSQQARVRGSGLENDGVFSNVQAKPALQRTVQDENGDVHVMPEESQKDAPPSYAVAQSDAVPPYWETTVHAPHFGTDDLLIEGLPPGTVFAFAWNLLISVSFQFVGFMLTYLLHTSHAAKYGARAGLGITLIQYGLFSREEDGFGFGSAEGGEGDGGFGGKMVRGAVRVVQRTLPALSSTAPGDSPPDGNTDFFGGGLSFLLMTIGWFLLLSSFLGFVRIKRWERSLRAAPAALTPEEMAHDRAVRNHLHSVFGIEVNDDEDSPRLSDSTQSATQSARSLPRHEAEFQRVLRDSGLI